MSLPGCHLHRPGVRRRLRRRRARALLFRSAQVLLSLGLLACVPWALGRPLPQPADQEPPASPAATPRADYRDFSAQRALATARFLSRTIGPRPAGSAAERRAARHVAARLRALGYAVRVQHLSLGPGGGRTQNVIGLRRHPRQAGRLLLGAHLDTVARDRCPGANDNASGVGTTLELARVLARADVPCSLEIVFFGAEEQQGARSLVGSNGYVQRCVGNRPRAMLCLDMVGRGADLRLVAGSGRASRLTERLRLSARRLGLACRSETSRFGSDHAPFAAVGVPAVWLQRVPDPDNHTRRDTLDRLDPAALQGTGRLVAHMVLHLRPADLGLPELPDPAENRPQVAVTTPDNPARRLRSARRSVGGFHGRLVGALGCGRAPAADRFAPGHTAEPDS